MRKNKSKKFARKRKRKRKRKKNFKTLKTFLTSINVWDCLHSSPFGQAVGKPHEFKDLLKTFGHGSGMYLYKSGWRLRSFKS